MKSVWMRLLSLSVMLSLFFVVLAQPVAASGSALQPTAPVPKTGQTTSYAAGDDGDLQTGVTWPDPRFSDLGDGTIADHLTGLIWAKDASTPTAGSCSGGVLPWYGAGGVLRWHGALDYVACLNSTNYLGYSDWILPNINEMKSLVDLQITLPANSFFTGVQSGNYWSSSTSASISDLVWVVNMNVGNVGFDYKDSYSYVWPVRRGAVPLTLSLPCTGQTTSYAVDDDGALQRGVVDPGARFTDNSDGTVTDNRTGLIWLQAANCLAMQSWTSALSSANTLSSGSCNLRDNSIAGDWRLPNRNELHSLVDYGMSMPSLPIGHPFNGVQSGDYWSSSTVANDSVGAWYVSMFSGYVNGSNKTDYFYVWPVRGGQSLVPLSHRPTGVTLVPTESSSQPTGSAVAFTGAAIGGDAGPYEYRFWYRSAATATYTLGRDYADSASWSWDTAALSLPAGKYYIAVEVRHVGSTVTREARLAVSYDLNVASPATSITVTRSLASPQPAGTAIPFTGLAGGGDSGPYEYRFWYRSAATATYNLGRDYATDASWSWNTAALALPAGSYVVAVETRHVGSTVNREARLAVTYKLISPATAITVTASVVSPQFTGTVITITGLAVGGDIGPYQYRFSYRPAVAGTPWTRIQDYSSRTTASWNTAALNLPVGAYQLLVDVRHVGSAVTYEAQKVMSYSLKKLLPATSITVTRSLASPQVTGTAITCTGLAGGGDSGPYEYRFWYRSAAAATYTLGRDYAASAAWVWDTAALALPAGNYYVAVEVRHVGSTALREARLAVGYTLVP